MRHLRFSAREVWNLNNSFALGFFKLQFNDTCLISSIFPAWEGGFGLMMYPSPERSPQDSRDRIFWCSAQASCSWPRVDLARLLRRAYSRSVWIISFEFVKVCGIRFSIWESFIGYLLLSYFYDPGMFIFRWSSNFVENVVLNESMSATMASRVSYLAYYYCR